MTASTTQGINTVLHPVSDLAAAKAVYAALLGSGPQTDGGRAIRNGRPLCAGAERERGVLVTRGRRRPRVLSRRPG